jgi:hypothetical protein
MTAKAWRQFAQMRDCLESINLFNNSKNQVKCVSGSMFIKQNFSIRNVVGGFVNNDV